MQFLCILIALSATAIEVPDAKIEGPIDNINFLSPAGVAELTSMGVKIQFTDGMAADGVRRKSIRTPVRELSITEFKDGTPLPGRAAVQGFVGGTVIAEGKFVIDGAERFFEADFLTVEPQENVLIGALMKKGDANVPFDPTNIQINGVDIEMLTDGRMPSDPSNPAKPRFLNQYGFPIRVASLVGADALAQPTAAEGYYANSRFYAFSFEFAGTGTLSFNATTNPHASVERAEIRVEPNVLRCNFRGHYAYSPQLGVVPTIQLFWDHGAPIGPVDIDFQETAADASYLRWRFSDRVVRQPAIPKQFRVVARANGVTLSDQLEDVEISRVEEAD